MKKVTEVKEDEHTTANGCQEQFYSVKIGKSKVPIKKNSFKISDMPEKL